MHQRLADQHAPLHAPESERMLLFACGEVKTLEDLVDPASLRRRPK